MLPLIVPVQQAGDVVNYISGSAQQQHTSTFISYASLLIAALAVLVGPFVQRSIASRQMLGQMRQTWINELRKRLSEFTTLCERLVYVPDFLPNKYETFIRIS